MVTYVESEPHFRKNPSDDATSAILSKKCICKFKFRYCILNVGYNHFKQLNIKQNENNHIIND